jgi:toxin ParE1/3/4
VAEFRLSTRARAQLIDIYVFTESRFGAYQAEAYHSGLERTFALIADFPRIGQPVEELAARYRRFRFQSHYIYYTEETMHVLIRALIHCAQQIRPELFE